MLHRRASPPRQGDRADVLARAVDVPPRSGQELAVIVSSAMKQRKARTHARLFALVWLCIACGGDDDAENAPMDLPNFGRVCRRINEAAEHDELATRGLCVLSSASRAFQSPSRNDANYDPVANCDALRSQCTPSYTRRECIVFTSSSSCSETTVEDQDLDRCADAYLSAWRESADRTCEEAVEHLERRMAGLENAGEIGIACDFGPDCRVFLTEAAADGGQAMAP
jgi:hypothetical protein